jgi:hypothetical protein
MSSFRDVDAAERTAARHAAADHRQSLWMVAPFAVLGFSIGLSVNLAVALVLGAVVGAVYWFMWRPGGPNRRKVLRKYGPAAFGLMSEDD